MAALPGERSQPRAGAGAAQRRIDYPTRRRCRAGLCAGYRRFVTGGHTVKGERSSATRQGPRCRMEGNLPAVAKSDAVTPPIAIIHTATCAVGTVHDIPAKSGPGELVIARIRGDESPSNA